MIFISYASDDLEYARALYVALHAVGLAPWMDKPPPPHVGLLIGEKWEAVLRHRIANADFIVLVLSPRSVSKRGYVQVEFRMALDRMNYLPDNDVLVLPVLAEQCAIPDLTVGRISLTDLQWQPVPTNEIEQFAGNLSDRFGAPT